VGKASSGGVIDDLELPVDETKTAIECLEHLGLTEDAHCLQRWFYAPFNKLLYGVLLKGLIRSPKPANEASARKFADQLRSLLAALVNAERPNAAVMTNENADTSGHKNRPASARRRGSRQLTQEERNAIVEDYLVRNCDRAARGDVTIRKVSDETGISSTSVHRTAAWTTLQAALEKRGLSKRPTRGKTQPYTSVIDAAAAEGVLSDLTDELTSASVSGKGRRGPVGVRQKF
jgi:hypothetical protein